MSDDTPVSGYEVDLKRPRRDDTQPTRTLQGELDYTKDQLARVSQENADLQTERDQLQAVLAKDQKTIRQLRYFEKSFYQFQTMQRIVESYNMKLLNVSRRRALVGRAGRQRDGALNYIMNVRMLQWATPYNTEYIITIERRERAIFRLPDKFSDQGEKLVDPRYGFDEIRASKVTVATCEITIDDKSRKLEDVVFKTNAHPQMFLFNTHPADQTFEGKGFVSLLGHIMMLIACELDLVVSIEAETGTTRGWLENHYSNFKVSSKIDDKTGQVLKQDSKKPNGQDNWKRASGDYYGNMDAYVIHLNKGPQTPEQENTVQHAVHQVWKPHILQKLTEWFDKARTEVMMKFGLNQATNSMQTIDLME